MKKLFVGAAATAMAFAFGTTGVFAAGEDTREVTVTYDNSDVITDPTDPQEGKWGVKVPSTIIFTDTQKTRTANVEMVGLNDYNIADLGMNVDVTVNSKNAMNMEMSGVKADAVAYKLTYGSQEMTATTPTALTLNLTSATPKQDGTAIMTGTAKEMGQHTDVLTYKVVSKNK